VSDRVRHRRGRDISCARISPAGKIVIPAAALRALATEGIQKGHMRLHARNMAVRAGAPVEIVDEVVRRLSELEKFDFGTAETVVKEVKKERGPK